MPGQVLVDVSSIVVARRSPGASSRMASERLVWRDRYRRGAWNAVDMGYIMALFVIVVLNLLDITITLIHTSNVGWEAEANLLIRHVAESAGEGVVVLFKLALVGAALGIMWYLFRRSRHAVAVARDRSGYKQAVMVHGVILAGTSFLLLFYVWVVLHNVGVVWG